MLEWLAASWGPITTVISIVLAVVSVYLGIKAWKRKKPTYFIHSNNIFSGLDETVPGVEVKFVGYGSPLKALTVSKVAFWNAGTETINKQDVVRDDPVRLVAKAGVVLLSVNVIERTRALNKVECTLNRERTEATITFDYLDHQDGALLQVFHTSTVDDAIHIKGTIKGAPPINKRWTLGSASPRKQKPPSRWLLVLALFVIWVCLAVLGCMMSFPVQLAPKSDGFLWLDIAFDVLLAILGLLITGLVAYVLYATTVPKRLSRVFR